MKKALLLSFVVCLSAGTFAQSNCNVTLPSGTMLVKSADGSHTNFGDALWICEGVTYEVTAGPNFIYCEKNVNLTVSGDDCEIHMKAGGMLTITGDNNKILNIDAGITPDDQGNNNTNSSLCDTVFFKYNNRAGTPKICGDTSAWAGVFTVRENKPFRLFPNPVDNILYLEMERNTVVVSYSLFTITGQVEVQKEVNGMLNSIDLSEVNPGLYFLQLQTLKGIRSQRITVE